LSSAQQPAYFILGEKQFRGIQIYDVVQDKNHHYYFATNSGIFHYDFYNYTKIDCDGSKSLSVFNFVRDQNGIIYCHNLNNQIFQIKNVQCRLFYELDNDDAHSDISLSVSSKNELMIGAKKVILLDSNASVLNSFDKHNKYLGPPFLHDNKILFHLRSSDTVLIYESGRFSKSPLVNFPETDFGNSVLKFFNFGDSIFALDLRGKKTYRYDPKSRKLAPVSFNAAFKRSASIRVYETKNRLWVTGTLPGVMLLDEKLNSLTNDTLYQDYFISDIYEDHEGNILLSTFDKGVLVIQDVNVPDVIRTFRDDPATSLHFDADVGLLVGTSHGSLLSYQSGFFNTISNKGERPVEGIYGDALSDYLIFDDVYIRAYNKKSKRIEAITEASLKDVAFITPNSFYLGTNVGVIKCVLTKNGFESSKVAHLNQRIYALKYDRKNQLLYASTSAGLICSDTLGNFKPISFKGKDLFPLDINLFGGKLYASTADQGVLIFFKDQLIDSIMPKISDRSVMLEKFLIDNNSIIAKCAEGLFVFDMQGQLKRVLNSEFGFADQGVIDFVLQGKTLWVSHSGGVQALYLNYTRTKVGPETFFLKSVFVNGEKIGNQFKNRFSSNQRRIEFEFSVPTLRQRESINYYYKLEGFDEHWHVSTYVNNRILYNALGPGKYTLRAKASINNIDTGEIRFNFSIATPFYLSLWFVFSIASLFIVAVFLIYRWRLNVQRTKSRQINELNASKLTAIQSQMNPHFIFNALNSIQDLILKGNVEHSYSYITTFSNMVRRTLDYSDKDFIEFEQEIKLLELYLSLEKLRFKKDLEYNIEIMNVEDILLPPLLIQPFIENSLVHGLLHKEGIKRLVIKFELAENLICTIEDNGIGREKSKTIQQRQRSDHQSFSGRAIRNRFEIFGEVFGGDFGYAYYDLNEGGKPVGTKVVLRIPVKHKF